MGTQMIVIVKKYVGKAQLILMEFMNGQMKIKLIGFVKEHQQIEHE